MPNIEEIKKNLASMKSIHAKQGDFTLYASKYIQHVEVLLRLVEGSPAATAKTPLPGVDPVVRKKKKLSTSNESTD